MTRVAGEREAFGIVAATVLAGDDVLDLENVEGVVRLAQPAILTTITRPLPYKLPRAFVDHAPTARLRWRRALAWRIAIISPACT